MTTTPTPAAAPAPTPRNLFVSSIRLTAGLTAVGQAREFIRRTLGHWQLTDVIDSAELVVSELATNAIKSTDFAAGQHAVGVQLRLVDARLYIEVWDGGEGAAVVPEQSVDAEGGRGLFLVESLCDRWDTYRPEVGGKVVWGRLPLTGHGTVADRAFDLVDRALIQRALDGLRQLPA